MRLRGGRKAEVGFLAYPWSRVPKMSSKTDKKLDQRSLVIILEHITPDAFLNYIILFQIDEREIH